MDSNTFCGARLREPLNINTDTLFSGATTFVVVNRFGTFQKTFRGCESTCWPPVDNQMPTGVPRRGFQEQSDCHDTALAYAEVAERSPSEAPFSGKSYPNKCARPAMAFTPSGFTFQGVASSPSWSIVVLSGEHKDKQFLPLPALCDNGKAIWILKDRKTKKELKKLCKNYSPAELETVPVPTPHGGSFLCISCGQSEPEDFLLCKECFFGDPNESLQVSDDEHLDGFDFSREAAVNRKDNGLQDDGDQTMRTVLSRKTTKCPMCQQEKPERIYVCLTCERVALCIDCRAQHEHPQSDGWCNLKRWKPSRRLKSTEHYPPLDEGRTEETRPLDEMELAWILAKKYPGFTNKYNGCSEELSTAYQKARLATVQLAGHYLLNKSFEDIARITGKETEAVKKFCHRARTDYFEKFVRQPMPDEVRISSASGMLRELYPASVSTGTQFHGKHAY